MEPEPRDVLVDAGVETAVQYLSFLLEVVVVGRIRRESRGEFGESCGSELVVSQVVINDPHLAQECNVLGMPGELRQEEAVGGDVLIIIIVVVVLLQDHQVPQHWHRVRVDDQGRDVEAAQPAELDV